MERRTRFHTAPIVHAAEVLPAIDRLPSVPQYSAGGLRDYGRLLLSRKLTLITVTLLCALLGVLIAWLQEPMYRATASLEVLNLNDRFLNLGEVTPISNTLPASTAPDVQSLMRLLQSHTLADRVIAKLRKDMPAAEESKGLRIVTPQWLIALIPALQQPEASAEEIRTRYVSDAVDSLKVRAAGQSRIIDLMVDSSKPVVAQRVVNTLAEEFIEENLEARLLLTQSIGKWLTRQLDETRLALERSERSLQQYTAETGLVFLGADEKRNVSDQKLNQLQEALSNATADRIGKQSRFETVRKNKDGDDLPSEANTAALQELTSKLTDLRREAAELATVYTPQYAKVKRVQSQIVTLESALRREQAAIAQRFRNDLEEAVRRENLLEAQYVKHAQLVTNEGQKAIRYNLLKRQVDTNRQLYEGMLHRVNEANLASAVRASNVRVFDPAKQPREAYAPSVAWNATFGLLLGGFLSVGFVILRHEVDPKLWASSQAALATNVMDLGTIPCLPAARRKPKQVGGLSLKHINTGAPELFAWEQRLSLEAESFRSLGLSLLFSRVNDRQPRVVVITSPEPGEGKTTVATNLSIAITETGLRVLLIDADLRKPRLHQIFGVESEKGLTTLLSGESLRHETLTEAIRETGVPGLYVLPSGPLRDSAAKVLYSDTFEKLLDLCGTRFDMVIIDSPPMLPFPDARILGRKSDGIIVVARWSETSRGLIELVQNQLLRDNTPVLGVVLNDCSGSLSSDYGRYLTKSS